MFCTDGLVTGERLATLADRLGGQVGGEQGGGRDSSGAGVRPLRAPGSLVEDLEEEQGAVGGVCPVQVGPQGGCPRRSEKRDAGEGRRRGEDPSLCWVPPMSGNSAFHMGLPWARELPSKASPCASLSCLY